MNVKILNKFNEPELIIASAAKLCYSPSDIDDLIKKQTPEMVEKFINRLMEMGHCSPLEHASFSFGIENVSRITEIQLVRHRLASYSIQSGRYVNRQNASFTTPPRIDNNSLAKARYEKAINDSMGAYNDLFIILMLSQMGYTEAQISNMSDELQEELILKLSIDDKRTYSKYEKLCVEDARYAQLQSLHTKIIVTMNVRSLLNFFEHRCCFRAQWEIRSMANKMLLELKKTSPILFKNAGAKCKKGYCPENNMQCDELSGTIPTLLELTQKYNK